MSYLNLAAERYPVRPLKYVKFLDADGSGTYSHWRWPLPGLYGEPGAWTPSIWSELRYCRNGYHYTDSDHMLPWFSTRAFEIEPTGSLSREGSKYVCRSARLVRELTYTHQAACMALAGILEIVGAFILDCFQEGKPTPKVTPHDDINLGKNQLTKEYLFIERTRYLCRYWYTQADLMVTTGRVLDGCDNTNPNLLSLRYEIPDFLFAEYDAPSSIGQFTDITIKAASKLASCLDYIAKYLAGGGYTYYLDPWNFEKRRDTALYTINARILNNLLFYGGAGNDGLHNFQSIFQDPHE